MNTPIHILKDRYSRYAHRHGFGIQSPWAYELVRDVLFEKNAYYAYREQNLMDEYARLMFRIRNHFRSPWNIVEYEGNATTEINTSNYSADTILIIKKDTPHNIEEWNKVVRSNDSAVTFDMKQCGIAFFDHKRAKQNYTL